MGAYPGLLSLGYQNPTQQEACGWIFSNHLENSDLNNAFIETGVKEN